jgi:hypothetical protein
LRPNFNHVGNVTERIDYSYLHHGTVVENQNK